MRTWVGLVAVLAVGCICSVAMGQDAAGNRVIHPTPQGTQIVLTEPFHTRSAWRLVVNEGPPVQHYGGIDAPGALAFCLHQGSSGPCIPKPVTLPLHAPSPEYSIAWEPHYLLAAKVVYPRGPKAAPLLLIVTESLNSGDGDQVVTTQLIAYDAATDTFRRIFGERTGHNNNQEIRFVTDGPLRGSVITAEPQEHPPYGYWIVVKSLNPGGAYRQVLRYRGATLYNDGNPLAVIDSEMPNIERRLGLWKPGVRSLRQTSAAANLACGRRSAITNCGAANRNDPKDRYRSLRPVTLRPEADIGRPAVNVWIREEGERPLMALQSQSSAPPELA